MLKEVNSYRVKDLQKILREKGLDANGKKQVLRDRLVAALEGEECHKVVGTEPKKDVIELDGEDDEAMPVEQPEVNEQPSSEAMEVEEDLESPTSRESAGASDMALLHTSPSVADAKENPLTSPMDVDNDLERRVSAKKLSAKRSRSPLRCVQSSISSAIKRFSKSPLTKKPALGLKGTSRSPLMKFVDDSDSIFIQTDGKETAAPVEKPAEPLVRLVEPSVEPVEESEEPSPVQPTAPQSKDPQPTGPVVKAAPLTSKPTGSSLSARLNSHTKSSASRLLTAKPVAAGSVSSTKSVSSHSSTSAKEKEKLLASKSARMQRIQELREKTKMPSSSTSSVQIPPLENLKLSTASTDTENGKRKFLAAKMREKTMQKTKPLVAPAALSTVPENSFSSKSKPPLSSSKSARSMSKLNILSPSTKANIQRSPANGCPDPADLMSPMSTYSLTDHEGDSDSEDERPAKKIPSWARRDKLNDALLKQIKYPKHDPDEIFGQVLTCDLTAIFDLNKKRYQRRTSSANWDADRATIDEELAYKRSMKLLK